MQIGINALEEGLNLIKRKKPLIYCISNLVGITELAKGILAYNGIPAISNCLDQMEEKDFTNKCILLNTDNLDTEKLDAMETKRRREKNEKLVRVDKDRSSSQKKKRSFGDCSINQVEKPNKVVDKPIAGSLGERLPEFKRPKEVFNTYAELNCTLTQLFEECYMTSQPHFT